MSCSIGSARRRRLTACVASIAASLGIAKPAEALDIYIRQIDGLANSGIRLWCPDRKNGHDRAAMTLVIDGQSLGVVVSAECHFGARILLEFRAPDYPLSVGKDAYVYLTVPKGGSVGRDVLLYEGAAASIEDSPDPGTHRLVERLPTRVVGMVRIDIRPDAPQR